MGLLVIAKRELPLIPRVDYMISVLAWLVLSTPCANRLNSSVGWTDQGDLFTPVYKALA